MKLCPNCDQPRWPFLVIFVITTVIAFTTWLVLGLTMMPQLPRAAVSGLVFLGVGATLVHYVISCLRRHCRHDHPPGHSADHAFR